MGSSDIGLKSYRLDLITLQDKNVPSSVCWSHLELIDNQWSCYSLNIHGAGKHDLPSPSLQWVNRAVGDTFRDTAQQTTPSDTVITVLGQSYDQTRWYIDTEQLKVCVFRFKFDA